MPRQKPSRTLLIDEDWIYELSTLNAESKLLQKHSDKIHQLHFDALQKLVGRCFVDELLKVKAEADQNKSDDTDWTDSIDKKYLEILEHQDFRAWYAKTLEYLITVFSGSEFKGDGLVRYTRELEHYMVQNVSTSERKERQDSLLRYLPRLQSNLMEHVVKPNILLFSCLKTKFGSSQQVQPFKLDTFSAVVGGQKRAVEHPVMMVQNIIVNEPLEPSEQKTTATYNYIASPLNGSFTIDYSHDLDINDRAITIEIYNAQGQKIEDFDWNNYEGEFVKIWINDYQNSQNLTGTITIKVS